MTEHGSRGECTFDMILFSNVWHWFLLLEKIFSVALPTKSTAAIYKLYHRLFTAQPV